MLRQRHIGFAHAPGSNAESVAEYVLAALCELARKKHFSLRNTTLGIIGVGNIGSKVWRKAKLLGMNCLLCDPPKKRLTSSAVFKSHEEVFTQSDIITLHVPLIREGEEATYHMINDDTLSHMKKNAMLINTSRGNVVDENALLRHVKSLGGLVLDVWEHEPDINREVLAATDIATPHIAGYSYEGKLRGTAMLYEAACDFYFKQKNWHINDILKKEQEGVIEIATSQRPFHDAVLQAYPIMNDDTALREIKNVSVQERGQFFDRLRRDYPRRREFSHYRIQLTQGGQIAEVLSGLGFKTHVS
jgi:erythronate-4-phosphate dehydrogenase